MVDPVACRVALFVANRTEITPNALTRFSLILGMVSAACFAANRLVLGAVVFYVSFMIDCVDGKIARLKGTGTPFGLWLDYVGDRFRVVCCAFGLAYGQYVATGRMAYVLLGAGIAILDLFRYVNAPQMKRVRQTVKSRRRAARREELAAVRDAMAVESLDQGAGYAMCGSLLPEPHDFPDYTSRAHEPPDHGYGSGEPFDQMAEAYDQAGEEGGFDSATRRDAAHGQAAHQPGDREAAPWPTDPDAAHWPIGQDAAPWPVGQDAARRPGEREAADRQGERETDGARPGDRDDTGPLLRDYGATIPRQGSIPGDSLAFTRPLTPESLSYAPPSPSSGPYDQAAAWEAEAPVGARQRLGHFLARHRVRTHLMSGIEFHAAVFVIAPLGGPAALLPVTTCAGALLVLNEIFLVYRMWLSTRALAGRAEPRTAGADDQHVRTDPFFTGV